MNGKAIVRLTNITTPPADANLQEAPPLRDEDRVVLMFSGPLNIQWPVLYSDTKDGAVAAGDRYEITLRKLPDLGLRIGGAPDTSSRT